MVLRRSYSIRLLSRQIPGRCKASSLRAHGVVRHRWEESRVARYMSLAKMFEVTLSTVKRYLKLRSQTGQPAPKPISGRTPTRGAVLATDLPAQLAAHHDFTLEQHCKL